MKKSLLLLALSFLSASTLVNAKTNEASFDLDRAHAPHYSTGKCYENVPGWAMIQYKNKTVDGTVQNKPAIADYYSWIEYVNPTSQVDDGTAEVQVTNSRWSQYNPDYDDYNYGEGANWVLIKDSKGNSTSPVLSAGTPKYMVLYVKETSQIDVVACSTASCTAEDGNNMTVTAVSSDGLDIVEKTSKPGGLWGKGKSSDTVVVRLNPEKAYKVIIKGNEEVKKDIMLANVRLYGTSTQPGPDVKVANPTFAYYDVVVGPDMVTKGGNKVKTDNGVTSDKYGIRDDMGWIKYINPTSTLDDGTPEVQTANRWTTLNPRTGETGDFIQVKDANGNAYSPVISAEWGKYMIFYVTGTNKFTVYATGSGGKSPDDGNRLLVEAYPYNSNGVIKAATIPGSIYGKGNGSDLLSIDLVEGETYEIIVKGDPDAKKDIQILGINLGTSEGDAYQIAGKGTLNIAIDKMLADKASLLSLTPGETYTLNGAAHVERTDFSLYGNNATIVTDETGQIVAKGKMFVQEVTIDASKSNVAPLAMANKDALTAADTTALYTYGLKYGTEAVYYTQAECELYNSEHAAEITAGTVKPLTTDSIKTPAVPGYKYPKASNAVFEGEGILVASSTLKVGSSVVSGGNAPWAINSLMFINCVVEVTKKSGKAIINWEEGASQIKNIFIISSTFYADSTNTNMRFLRYSAQVDPWRVWGYEGEDKNAPGLNEIMFASSTFVNVCGDKEFANNIKNTGATQLTFKNNVFANTWRLQKLGGNLTFNFTYADNAIMGGKNDVDNTDKTKFATLDEVMGVVYNDSVKNFVPGPFSYAAKMKYGDPRWLKDVVYVDAGDSLKALIAEANALLTALDALTSATEYTNLQTEKTNADGIAANETATAKTLVDEIKALAAAIKAYQKAYTSGIETIATTRPADGKTYDLTGRQVEALSPGIYVHNRRVVVVK